MLTQLKACRMPALLAGWTRQPQGRCYSDLHLLSSNLCCAGFHRCRWFSAIFFGVHMMLICPSTTIGGIFALCWQRQGAKALNISGLTIQVVVFAFVAFSWILRARFSLESGAVPRNLCDAWYFFVAWYQLVGWAAVDNAIFAIVQFVLLFLAKYQGGGGAADRLAEEEPLLARQADACVDC